MRKLISTRTHGLIDYLMVGKLLVLPRVMGWNSRLTNGMTALGLAKLGYTLFTRFELAPVRKLPVSAHLALDVASSAAMCTMPAVLGNEDDDFAQEACCAMGAVEFAVAALTETRMAFPERQTVEYREQTATAREHLENKGRERSILAGRPI